MPKEEPEIISPQTLVEGVGVARNVASLISSGMSLADSITGYSNRFETAKADEDLEDIREQRWHLGLVVPGTDGVGGDFPIPNLIKEDLTRFFDYPMRRRKRTKLGRDSIAVDKGTFTPYAYRGTQLSVKDYATLLWTWYGPSPALTIRKRLLEKGKLAAEFSAENIRKMILPRIGFGRPHLPVGWTEAIAVKEGFAPEIRSAQGRLRSAAVADRGALAQDRVILETKVQNAASLARASKQAASDIQRITSGLPVGI